MENSEYNPRPVENEHELNTSTFSPRPPRMKMLLHSEFSWFSGANRTHHFWNLVRRLPRVWTAVLSVQVRQCERKVFARRVANQSGSEAIRSWHTRNCLWWVELVTFAGSRFLSYYFLTCENTFKFRGIPWENLNFGGKLGCSGYYTWREIAPAAALALCSQIKTSCCMRSMAAEKDQYKKEEVRQNESKCSAFLFVLNPPDERVDCQGSSSACQTVILCCQRQIVCPKSNNTGQNMAHILRLCVAMIPVVPCWNWNWSLTSFSWAADASDQQRLSTEASTQVWVRDNSCSLVKWRETTTANSKQYQLFIPSTTSSLDSRDLYAATSWKIPRSFAAIHKSDLADQWWWS